MAGAFQPKFVDLVRNYTSTEGTGSFALGPAANGYTSFAVACAPGDRFYYSAIGIDKPAETEVGRGTLQSDGSIAREPMNGVLTDFSAGSKSIALVAAAEWFAGVDAGVAASLQVADSRDALALLDDRAKPALLLERSREGLFVYDATDQSTNVSADPAQALHIAPASDPSGASGAWIRRFSGGLNACWFGAAGDGLTDDSAAIQAALTYFESIDGGELLLSGRSYATTATLLLLASDVTVDARGATLISADVNSIPGLFIGGDRTRILGGTWKLTGGFDDPRWFDVEGADCEIDGARIVKNPEAGGVQAYIRSSANAFLMRNCRTEGSNGIMCTASNAAFLLNTFVGRASGGDDAIAIDAIDSSPTNIRVIGNSFENLTAFCSIGSLIGVEGAADPTYSRSVSNVIVEGNTGTNCSEILFIKPGAVSAYDYRDGTVRQVVCSNNTLVDETGTKFNRGIALTPSRGGRIIDVKGRANVVIARSNGAPGRLVGALDCYIPRLTDGTAEPLIEDVDVEISYRDPFGGVATSASDPGFPVNNIATFELDDPSHGVFKNVRLCGSGDGCMYDGIFVGAGIADEEIHLDVRLRNVNNNGSSTFGGINTASAIRVAPTTRIVPLHGYPYKLQSTGDVRCPELTCEMFLNTLVAAGNSDTQYPWAATHDCQIIEMQIGTTNTVAQDDTNFTTLTFRNRSGVTGNVFATATTKLSGGSGSTLTTGFVAGQRSTVMHYRNAVSDAERSENLFGRGDVLLWSKSDSTGGTGKQLNNARLTVRAAPY